MKKSFKKSTILDIEQMFKWYKAGVSINEIGKRLKKDHASVIYQLKKSPEYIKGISGGRLLLKVPKDVSVDKFIAKKEAEEEKEIKFWEAGLCIFCKKPKQESWEKTSYCGLKCYISYYELKHLKQHKLCIY